MADGKVTHFYSKSNKEDLAILGEAIRIAIEKCSEPESIAKWLLDRFSICRSVPFFLSNDTLNPQ